MATTYIGEQGRKTVGVVKTTAGATLAAIVGGIVYSAFVVPHELPLSDAVTGERKETQGRAGRISYYVAGEGAPLLLIHSINAAASAYEVRPLFEHYRASRRVYALDLPGFGFSERGDRDYTPRLYADAILDMVDTITSDIGGAPIDALALSLSCEFLARAASERPEAFRSLALISPTGFNKGERRYGEPESVLGSTTLAKAFKFPLWGQALYDGLNSRQSERYFLERTFGSKDVDEGLVEYDYLTAHQPGARFAPLTFISGSLFSKDLDRLYDQLEMPVWLVHGVRGDFNDYSEVGKILNRPNWSVQVFQTGALPQFEALDEMTAGYDAFLRTP